ncbi:MAG: plasmid pRiA4b ORF-3 family protein, partial [Chitinivibrionales bacterium]|nr:plasmid pRiA4b ORF-3 family protein [Chitinivibrionales bacterium]
GWKDCHLHRFGIRPKRRKDECHIGIPDLDGGFVDSPDMQKVFPGWEIPAREGFKDLGVEAKYLYDFGDDWYHTVKLEGVVCREKGLKYPICIGGRRACPPEDCGGVPGYFRLQRALTEPDNEEFSDVREWIGGACDPEAFSPEAIRFDDPYKRWDVAFS